MCPEHCVSYLSITTSFYFNTLRAALLYRRFEFLRLWEICGRNPRTWVPPCSGQMVNTLSGTNDLESGSTRSSREPGDFHSISRRCSVATRGRTRQNYPREPQQPLFLG